MKTDGNPEQIGSVPEAFFRVWFSPLAALGVDLVLIPGGGIASGGGLSGQLLFMGLRVLGNHAGA